MSRHLETHVIDGVEYEVYGEKEMYPQLDENGLRINTGFDFYDVYTESSNVVEGDVQAPSCLFCINEGYPFWEKPTKEVIEKFLEDD